MMKQLLCSYRGDHLVICSRIMSYGYRALVSRPAIAGPIHPGMTHIACCPTYGLSLMLLLRLPFLDREPTPPEAAKRRGVCLVQDSRAPEYQQQAQVD